jgi:CRISPR-associated endonuclease Csn1
MKKILGLDIGTNSIGWSFIESNAYENPETLDGKIIKMGSRIIPMDGDAMSKFEAGTPESNAAGRRGARGVRRLNQRYKLRRTRLIQALQIVDWLPETFPKEFKKLDKHSINEYLPFSESLKNEAQKYFGDVNISEDWIIYFLKTKALTQQITLPELGRVLYHYNQRRGFKSSRKENKEEEQFNPNKQLEWNDILFIKNISVLNKGEGKDKDFTFFEVTCQSPTEEFKAIKKRITEPDWLNKSIEFKITKKTTKDGTIIFNIFDVDPAAWENRKLALEKDMAKAGLQISEYYLNNLKTDRNYRIKQRIVDRAKYQEEFKQIWATQSQFYENIFEQKVKIAEIADTFYIHNNQKNNELKGKDLFHIFFNDIIYYQRGLKSQKGQLGNCQYETKTFKNKNGETKTVGVKVTSRTNPLFQEFRIWQTIHNLKLIQKEDLIDGKLRQNLDVTDIYFTTEIKEKLFELFDKSKLVSHDAILGVFGFKKDKVEANEKTYSFKLNYPDDKDFIGNETKALFRKIFKKHDFAEKGEVYIADYEKLHQLWHIVYSLPEEGDIISALSNKKYFDLPESVIKNISKLPEFKPQYASYSVRALNNLLPLMRLGKYWDAENLISKEKYTKGFSLKPTINLLERIEALTNWVDDENIPRKVRELAQKYKLENIENYQGLNTTLACYVAYGRLNDLEIKENYYNIDEFKINELIPYNSIRNPVVEKVIRETLKLVKDVWKELGRPDFIHVELGREMKNNNAEREEITKNNNQNRVEKERIVKLLKELQYPNFNPDSQSDSDKFRIWKESGGKEGLEIFEDLFKKNNAEFVKDADIEKYRLWAEQGYKSPYSGQPIPLSWLYAIPKKVEIDHIIPKSKFYDDSFGNKVVVEAEFNFTKDKRLAIEFIEEFQNQVIHGTNRKVLNPVSYKSLVNEMFSNKKKIRHLLADEVPNEFVERQLNDTKYISKTVAQFLRPVALGSENIHKDGRKSIDDGLVFTSGFITSDLKGKWGLHKLWKEILKPRFERLEGILGEQLIFPDDKNGNIRFGKDYKRIDHRHHALDALVIAFTTRSHIKYLNSLNSLSNDKADFTKFGEWEKYRYLLKKKKDLEGMTEFATPWGTAESFYTDVLKHIESIIVSHKPTSKLISKAINKYSKYVEQADGTWQKEIVMQTKPKDDDKYWVSVRQSLFGQPLGKIRLAEYQKNIELKKVIKIEIDYLKAPGGFKEKRNTELWRVANFELRLRIDNIIIANNYVEKEILKFLEKTPLYSADGEKIEKLDVLQFKKYASKRVSIDETFTADKIKNLPYSEHEKNWLPKLLKDHLEENENNPKIAFKGENLELLFKKAPFAINKVTRKEGGDKIELNNKLLDGDKGVNQFFLIEIAKELDKKTGELKTVRKYTTPPFLEVIDRLAKGLNIHDENPDSQYIVLSPGDLVYVPNEGETAQNINWEDKKKISDRIYIVKSFGDYMCYFLHSNIASMIQSYDSKIKKGEFESKNQSEKTKDGKQMIKANCIKLKIDRLGNITPIL